MRTGKRHAVYRCDRGRVQLSFGDEAPAADSAVAESGATALLALLTPAERVVAEMLSEGHSNQEIAERLQKTVHAVKFLLHRIYRKTGTANRTRLVAALRPGLAVGQRQTRT